MTRLRKAAVAAAMERADADAESVAHPPARDTEYLTILDAVDAALARRDDGEATARVALIQAYATAWAALGYGLWVVLEICVRVIVAIARAIASPWRKRDDDDHLWTTTMKRKGRPR